MTIKTFSKLSIIIILSFFLTNFLDAQTGRGKARISGVVVDEAGNFISSAKIVIQLRENEQIQFPTTANEKGEWAILGLGTGTWRVTASAEGYIPTYIDLYASQLEKNPKITLTLKKIEKSDKEIIQDETSLDFFENATQLYVEKKYDEAIAMLEKFLEKNPKAYRAHLNIGDCYQEKGELDKAIEQYNIVLEVIQKDELMGKAIVAKALASIGESYLKKNDFESAQKFLKQSIETSPENEILAYNVGEIYFLNQKIDEAIHYYELATQIKANWSAPYLKLGYSYLNKGDFEKARINLNKFLEMDPESPEAPAVKNIIESLEKIKK